MRRRRLTTKSRRSPFYKVILFVKEYRIFKDMAELRWRFFKYWLLIKVFNLYDVIPITDDKGRDLSQILVRKYKAESRLEFTIFLYSIRNYKNAEYTVIEHLKRKLNEYRALGYVGVYYVADIDRYTIINLLTNDLGFDEDEEQLMLAKFKNGKFLNKTVLYKPLNS